MKKIIPFLFIASILLNACGTGTPTVAITPTALVTETPQPKPATQVASKIPVKEEALKGLEITVWYPWYGGEASLFEALVKDFNSQNTWGITVTTRSQSNFTNLYDTVTAALPTKDKPDMVIALPENALEWNNNRVVTNLMPYVQDSTYGIDSSDIPAIFWNQDLVGDVRVAVPAQRTARFLLWNETWANELGFNTAPRTPDEFRRQACGGQQAMHQDASPQNDFMGGWYVDTNPMTAYAWLLAFDGGVLEGNDYRFLTPNNIAAFKFLRELSEATCAWQVAGTDPIKAFASREAMFITASLEDLPDVARAFASANSTDTWRVIPFPGTTTGTMVVYGSSYVVLKSTEARQLASWLFIRWLLDKEQDARWVKTTHLFPLRTSTVDLLADYQKSYPQWAEAIDLLPQAKTPPQLASWRKVRVMLGDGFDNMYRVDMPSGQVAAVLAQMEAISREISK